MIEQVREAISSATVYGVRRNKSHERPYEVFDCHNMWFNDKTRIIGTFTTHDEAIKFADKVTDLSIAQAAIDVINRYNVKDEEDA